MAIAIPHKSTYTHESVKAAPVAALKGESNMKACRPFTHPPSILCQFCSVHVQHNILI